MPLTQVVPGATAPMFVRVPSALHSENELPSAVQTIAPAVHGAPETATPASANAPFLHTVPAATGPGRTGFSFPTTQRSIESRVSLPILMNLPFEHMEKLAPSAEHRIAPPVQPSPAMLEGAAGEADDGAAEGEAGGVMDTAGGTTAVEDEADEVGAALLVGEEIGATGVLEVDEDVGAATGDDAGWLGLDAVEPGAFAFRVTLSDSAETVFAGQLESFMSAALGFWPAHMPPYSTLEPGLGYTNSSPCAQTA